jgi:hypothetical protein
MISELNAFKPRDERSDSRGSTTPGPIGSGYAILSEDPMPLYRSSPRAGLSVIDLIVVAALILIFLALLLPIIARLRGAAGQAQSLNNLKQLGIATHSYHDAFRKFPPAVGQPPGNADRDQLGTAHFFLLPFVEQDALFQKAGGFKGSPFDNDVAATVVPVFVDPQDASAPPQYVYKGWLATTSYAVNWLVFKSGENFIPGSIPDGTSNTLMFTQRYRMCNGNPTAWGYADRYYWAPMFAYYTTEKFQAAPDADGCDPSLPQSIGGPSILVGMCDGSAQAVRATVSAQTWFLLACPNDGQPIPNDAF